MPIHTTTATTSTQPAEQVSLSVHLCFSDAQGEHCGAARPKPRGRFRSNGKDWRKGKGSVTLTSAAVPSAAKNAGSVVALVGSRKKVFACPGRCSSALQTGTLVTLTAMAKPTYAFLRMDGCRAQRRGVCQVVLRRPMTLTVVFRRA